MIMSFPVITVRSIPHHSDYGDFMREYGTEPTQAMHDISLCYATAEQAGYLGIEEGAPLLKLHELIFDQRGRPLHNSLQLIRGDQFVFRI